MPKREKAAPEPNPRAVVIEQAFDCFYTAVTCRTILSSFHELLDVTGLRHVERSVLFGRLRDQLKSSWKAQSLWAKLEKRASHRDYSHGRDYTHGRACKDTKVLVIGAGPCGLRTAIECAFLGARTVLVEKRDRFSRNNVLHLWPYLITDLKNLGAKMLFGKFCAGAIDHISIRQLQCILLKVALLVGVEVHVNVAFEGLIEPPKDQTNVGWRCKCDPENHPVSEYQFDVLIGADGKRNTLSGFPRKEFRGKLAIAVTANFINKNTAAEARVEEISGVAFIFNQKFFLDLKEKTGIDLENIVYYKDDTHYFVMTAKKQSLLEKGVLKKDHADTVALLDRSNVNQEALMAYARGAADFSTNEQLPYLEYAVNHYGQADVAMFDFTSMFVAEHSSRIRETNGHRLLMALVGDSLLEPFWPTGSGCARGFLGAFDAAWMIRNLASGRMTPLQILAERESVFTLLTQTTPSRLHKNPHQFSIDPSTRYPNLSLSCVKPKQVLHLYDGEVDPSELEEGLSEVPAKRARNSIPNEYNIDSYSLLRWCQRVLNIGIYRGVHIVDFTSSWRSGLAFCALIHAFRPNLITITTLMECETAPNNQLAFDIAQKELGIAPVMTGEDMASYAVPDKLTMVSYLSQFYELFKHEPLPSSIPLQPRSKEQPKEEKSKTPRSPNRRVSLLSKIGARISKSKKRKEKEEGEESHLGSKKLRDGEPPSSVQLTKYNKLPMEEIANKLQVDAKEGDPGSAVGNGGHRGSKAGCVDGSSVSVTAMAEVLVAKFKSNFEEQPAPPPIRRMKGQPVLLAAQSASEICYFCLKRVYIMERQAAEGVFFHRHCLKCDYCGVGLRLNNHYCERPQGEGVKFYCYRHFAPETRTRPRRKRNFDVNDDSKENIPTTVITPAEETENQAHSDEGTPKKVIPAPLQLPEEPWEKAKKTPERIEFEISFDGQEEETEEEQFEHNLRASMSSDAILDNSDDEDDDSDDEYIYGYVSESEVARILDEWSGPEDDIFETATESLRSGGGTSLTLEEAVQLANTWKRQHSTENLLQAVERDGEKRRHPSRDAYERLYNGRDYDNGDDDDDDEGSSTEVEGDSEYETDDSSADEATEGESERTKGGGSTADTLEGGGTTTDSAPTTATSPTSPAVKAARASFFSAPPQVVRLDPWRMFNKDREVEAASMEAAHSAQQAQQGEVEVEEAAVDNSEEGRDTDISESLEMDSRGEEGQGSSAEGSIEDLLDEEEEEEEEEERECAMTEEWEEKEEDRHMEESEEGEVNGEGGENEEEELNEEELEKTAVSLAMEQLLVDIDQTSVGGSDKSTELDNLFPSDEDDNVFQAGKRQPADQEPMDAEGRDCTASEGTMQSVLRSVQEMEDTATTTTGEDTLQQVLQDVAAMPDLSESELEENKVFKDLDERFITDRRKPRRKKKERKDEVGESDSDLTISTPSESLSSSSSSSSSSSLSDLASYNQRFLATGDAEDDLKPDEDMMHDYLTTISMALQESFSDGEKDGSSGAAKADASPRDDDMNRTLQAEEEMEQEGEEEGEEDTSKNTTASSAYITPEISIEEEEQRESFEEFKDAKESLSPTTPSPVVTKVSSPPSFTPGTKSVKAVAKATPDIIPKDVPSIASNGAPKAPSSRPLPKGSKATDSKITKPGDLSSSQLTKGPRKLPEIPKPKLSVSQPQKAKRPVSQPQNTKQPVSQPQNTKKPVSQLQNTKKPVSQLQNTKKVVPATRKSSASVDSHNNLSTLKSAKPSSDSSKKTASSTSSQRTTSVSSDSSRTFMPRPLPRPGVARRVTSSTSSEKTNSSSGLGPHAKGEKGNRTSGRDVTKQDGANLKTVIHVDTGSLWSDSSTEHQASDSEAPRKKIPVDVSLQSPDEAHKPSVVCDMVSDMEDIPFADESEVEDRFYTPVTSKKDKPQSDPQDCKNNVRKRLLPNPPSADGSSPGLPTAQHIQSIKQAEQAKAKQMLSDRSWPATSENSGARGLSPASISTGAVLKRRPGVRLHEDPRDRRSSSYDTPGTPDVLSDSDDYLHTAHHTSTTTTPTSSTTELDTASPKGKKKKNKSSTASAAKIKMRKSKDFVNKRKSEEKSPGEETKKEKNRRSLLAMLLPGKSGDKHKDRLANTDGEYILPEKPKPMQVSIADKLKKHKTKHKRNKSADSLDEGLTSDIRGLKITSVFDREVAQGNPCGPDRRSFRPLPLAPKASVDEFSDSDESQVSVNTLMRRKDQLSTEGLDERVARKLQRVAARQQKRAEQQRLRAAQEIQRRLQEVDERQRELEDRGIAVEKALRGEGPEADVDENQLMGEWFNLVHEKNALVRYESELMVRAKELELEDRQARLQSTFRDWSMKPESDKTAEEIEAEGQLLDELLDVVEQRNSLVAMLEEDRLREQQEDRELENMMVKKGFVLSPLNYSRAIPSTSTPDCVESPT